MICESGWSIFAEREISNLDIKLQEILFHVHLLSCSNISCDNHIADIENIDYVMVYAGNISTSITVQYQNKVTSWRNITPDWNRELDYARERLLFWKWMSDSMR